MKEFLLPLYSPAGEELNPLPTEADREYGLAAREALAS